MQVVIRVDSSLLIGSGHLMRSLTLAEELRRNGLEVTFISRAHDGNMNFMISKKGFKVLELPKPKLKQPVRSSKIGDNYSQWLGVSQKQDAKESIHIFGSIYFDWLIVDHYGLDEVWEKRLKPYVRNMMVIDDIANRVHHCDLLLDQNWFKNKEKRYNGLVPETCTKLLGPQYVLLRREFFKVDIKSKIKRGKINRIFIFFGGSDPNNLTGMALEALLKKDLLDIDVDVVIGESNLSVKELKKLVEKRPNTILHVQINNIAEIISKADLAIGSGGGNIWERIYLQVPSITISFAENQDIILRDLAINGILENLGNYSNINKNILAKKIMEKVNKPSDLLGQIKKMKKLIIRDGSPRITDWLIGDLKTKEWEVKSVTKSDSELLWIWANDSQIRENSLKKNKIAKKDHEKWFKNKLNDKKCTLYIVFIENQPVGQVRFDVERKFAYIDFSIAKHFRSRKLGRKLLYLSIEKFRQHSVLSLLGEVIPGNITSEQIFESLDFDMQLIKGKKVYTKCFN
jgi:UDP-2,4-diacetamido-2,4,6-trideoxy-beta-L-altropyranose hydrolase